MSEILHANIFFVIASVATVVFCIMICVALYHIIKLVKAARKVVERVEAGSEQLAEDLTVFRSYIAQGGILSRLFGFFMPTVKKTNRKKDSKSK